MQEHVFGRAKAPELVTPTPEPPLLPLAPWGPLSLAGWRVCDQWSLVLAVAESFADATDTLLQFMPEKALQSGR